MDQDVVNGRVGRYNDWIKTLDPDVVDGRDGDRKGRRVEHRLEGTVIGRDVVVECSN